MTKGEQADLVLRILGLFQTLPLMAVASEEASAIKQMLKVLHGSLQQETSLPQLTGEANVTNSQTPAS